MSAKRASSTRRKSTRSGILLRYREQDSPLGVSRATTIKLADTLGVTETQVIHVALAQLARHTLPRYEADNGPLTEEQYQEIAKRVPQMGFASTKNRLY